MNYFIALVVRSIMLTAYLINVHLVIQPLFHLRYEIEEHFNKLVPIVLFLIIPSALALTMDSNLPIGFQTRVFYYLWLVAFVGLMRNVYGILLGCSFVFFVSEFWEIPIYLYRLVLTGEFAVYDNVSQLFTLVGILSRLSVIGYIIFFMFMIGVDHIKFLKILAFFSLLYVPTAFYVISHLRLFPFVGQQFAWFCRMLCMLVMYLYMFRYYKPR